MDLGKIPPHDIEAEQAVIGSMLTDSDAVVEAIETLKSDDFYRQDNKTIYEAIYNLYNKLTRYEKRRNSFTRQNVVQES